MDALLLHHTSALSLSEVTRQGYTALTLALQVGSLPIARLILANGASVSLSGKWTAPRHRALQPAAVVLTQGVVHCGYAWALTALHTLLEHGADVSFPWLCLIHHSISDQARSSSANADSLAHCERLIFITIDGGASPLFCHRGREWDTPAPLESLSRCPDFMWRVLYRYYWPRLRLLWLGYKDDASPLFTLPLELICELSLACQALVARADLLSYRERKRQRRLRSTFSSL